MIVHDWAERWINPAFNMMGALAATLTILMLAYLVFCQMRSNRKYPAAEIVFIIFSLAAAYSLARHVGYWFLVTVGQVPNPLVWLRPTNKYFLMYIVLLAGGVAVQMNRQQNLFVPPKWAIIFKRRSRTIEEIEREEAQHGPVKPD